MTEYNNTLDSLHCELTGRIVIEAAAGTGKTYNIQNLFARLLTERNCSIDKIVVVTFTKAATAELKMRIRKVLTDILAVLDGDSDDQRATELIEAVQNTGQNRNEIRKRVNNAILDFDMAQIFTIDGFCQRIQNEFAVESGLRFAVNPVSSNTEKIAELSSLFTRRLEYRFQQENPEKADIYLALANCTGANAATLQCLMQKLDDNPDLVIDQLEQPEQSVGDIVDDCLRLMTDLRRLRSECPEAALDEFISMGQQKKKVTVQMQRQEFKEACWLQDASLPLPPDCMKKLLEFSECFSNEKSNNDYLPAGGVQALQGCLNRIAALPKDFRNAWLQSGISMVTAQLAEYRHRTGDWSYANIMYALYRALARNEALRLILRRRFQAVIIDEFQDTNSIQYGIFDRIFGDDEHTFFMVGDPRQAIYSFRGGDINAYLKARRDTEANGRIYTLSTNYRSTANILRQISLLFSGNSFAVDGITLDEIRAGGDGSTQHFYRDNVIQEAPLYIENALGQETDRTTRAIWQVRELLSGRYQIDDENGHPRPLHPDDIAILCIKNTTAVSIMHGLHDAGIPAFHGRNVNIFDTDEAYDMQTFMNGVINSDNINAVCMAMKTGICGKTMEEIAGIATQPERFAAMQTRLRALYETWSSKSFSALFTDALELFNTTDKLAGGPNAERRIVNFHHLADLIQTEESRRRLTPAASLKAVERFIAEAKNSETPDGFEQQLASEKSAVSLMTIHYSKGLEFPVVLLPDIDDAASNNPTFKTMKQMVCCHKNGQLHFDAGEETLVENRNICTMERFQEKLRLTYVAVTRAKFAVFIIRSSSNRKSKICYMNWLLNGTGNPDGNAKRWLTDETCPEFNTFTCQASANVPALCETGDTEELREPPAVDPAFADSWRITSYSAIVRHASAPLPSPVLTEHQSLMEMRDDEQETDRSGVQSENNASLPPSFDFPRGKLIGTLIHNCLETLDFTLNPDSEELKEATRKAFAWRYDEKSAAFNGLLYTLQQLLRTVFTLHDGTPFQLRDLAASNCRRELPFHFAIGNEFQWNEFRTLLGQNDDDETTLKQIQLNSGSLFTGIIDMLFMHEDRIYILDWKSDSLNSNPDAFRNENLDIAMRSSGYDVQYHIYMAAVIRYMEQRLGRNFDREMYDRHFGGAYYVYIRGVNTEGSSGLCFLRPDCEHLEKIRRLFRNC